MTEPHIKPILGWTLGSGFRVSGLEGAREGCRKAIIRL